MKLKGPRGGRRKEGDGDKNEPTRGEKKFKASNRNSIYRLSESLSLFSRRSRQGWPMEV